MSTNKKELMLPADTYASLTARLHRQREELDLAQAAFEEVGARKSAHEKARKSWENHHSAVVTLLGSLSREARESQDLAHALLAVEESLDSIRARTEWYDEESLALHQEYLVSSQKVSVVGTEVSLLEKILSRSYCEGATEGVPVEE